MKINLKFDYCKKCKLTNMTSIIYILSYMHTNTSTSSLQLAVSTSTERKNRERERGLSF